VLQTGTGDLLLKHQRAQAVPATTERRPMHTRTTVLAALPQPRHAASAVADVAASHTGLRGPVLPIECVRTYAPGISTGAVAVFRAFSTPSPAPRSGFAGSSLTSHSSHHRRTVRGIVPPYYE